MNEWFTSSIQHLLHWLPEAVAMPFYHRLVRPWIGRCPSAFERVSLKACPGVMMNLEPGDTGHRQIAALGVYESKLTRLVAKLAVEQGGMLLDVGANYGYYSLLWCGLNPANRSRAFEASPRVAARLRENIVLNGMADGIEVFEWAATNTEGSIPFDPGPPGPDRVGRHRERWRR